MNGTRNQVRSVADVLDGWVRGEISTSRAISLGGFDDFADLLEASLNSGVGIRTTLMPYEEEQARRFAALVGRPT